MPTMQDMTGQVALVTGAGGGLGGASAVRLAELGADVAVLDVSADALAGTAEKVRAMIEGTRFVFEGRHIPVTISVGVAELAPSLANADDLIKMADARLYKAKEGGRNRVIVD